MRNKRTGKSQRLTLVRGGGGEEESGSALSIYGPRNLASTTSQRTTKVQALSESLNSLEREVQTLESRFYEVCVTLNLALGHLVERKIFGTSADTIDEDSGRE